MSCARISSVIAFSVTLMICSVSAQGESASSDSARSFAQAPTKPKKKSKRKPTETKSLDTTADDASEQSDEPQGSKDRQSNYVSYRSLNGVGLYTVEERKAKTREVLIAGLYSTGSGTTASEDSREKSTGQAYGFGSGIIVPLNKISFGLSGYYEDGSDKSNSSPTKTSSGVNSTIKTTGIVLLAGIGYSPSPLIDIGLSLERQDVKGTISNTITSDAGESTQIEGTLKWSHTIPKLAIGAHKFNFECSMSYQPAHTATISSDITIDGEKFTPKEESESEEPSKLFLQGRYRFLPRAFAGLLLQSESGPHEKETDYGFEGAYILNTVQLGANLLLGSGRKTDDDSDDAYDKKSTVISLAASFKNTEVQTFSLGTSFSNSSSSGTGSASGFSSKSTAVQFIAGGYLHF